MQALMMRGHSFDCGSKLGYLQANVAFGLQDAAIAADLLAFLGMQAPGQRKGRRPLQGVA